MRLTTKNVPIKMLEKCKHTQKNGQSVGCLNAFMCVCVKLNSMHVKILKMCSTTHTTMAKTMNQSWFVKRLVAQNVCVCPVQTARNFWITWRNMFRVSLKRSILFFQCLFEIELYCSGNRDGRKNSCNMRPSTIITRYSFNVIIILILWF